MTVIELPWPHKDLFPNARIHWAKRMKVVKQARNDAAWFALQGGIRRHDFAGQESLNIGIVFTPPDNRRRDTDGMFSSCKAYFDGISDVIGIDDSKWVFTGIKRESPRKPGAVRVEISAVAFESKASPNAAGQDGQLAKAG